MKYKMISYRRWNGEKNLDIKSNNLDYFKQFLNKSNYRSMIYEKFGNRWKLIYSEA